MCTRHLLTDFRLVWRLAALSVRMPRFVRAASDHRHRWPRKRRHQQNGVLGRRTNVPTHTTSSARGLIDRGPATIHVDRVVHRTLFRTRGACRALVGETRLRLDSGRPHQWRHEICEHAGFTRLNAWTILAHSARGSVGINDRRPDGRAESLGRPLQRIHRTRGDARITTRATVEERRLTDCSRWPEQRKRATGSIARETRVRRHISPRSRVPHDHATPGRRRLARIRSHDRGGPAGVRFARSRTPRLIGIGMAHNRRIRRIGPIERIGRPAWPRGRPTRRRGRRHRSSRGHRLIIRQPWQNRRQKSSSQKLATIHLG